MEKWAGKIAVVTGASSGIGAAVAEKLVCSGVIVVGFARRVEKIEELSKKLKAKSGKLHAVKVDLKEEKDILNAFKWVLEKLGPISILINNAGIMKKVYLTKSPTSDFRDIFEVNVMALCICTREASKIMMENKIDGHIIHISSVAAHYIISADAGVYCASKFSVRALTETLRKEFLEGKCKIKITSIDPGVVETDLVDDFLTKEEASKVTKLKPEDIAEAIAYALGTPPHVQIQEIIIKSVGEVF